MFKSYGSFFNQLFLGYPFLTFWVAEAAIVGLKIGESIFGASSARDQARDNIKSIDEQIALMNKQKEELALAYGQKKEMVTDQFGNKVEQLTEGTGQALGDIREQSDVAASKTGLSFSGTVERGQGKAEERTRDAFGYKREGLYDMLGESLFNIEMQQMEKFGEIDTSVAALQQQRKIEKEKSNDYFLGIF